MGSKIPEISEIMDKMITLVPGQSSQIAADPPYPKEWEGKFVRFEDDIMSPMTAIYYFPRPNSGTYYYQVVTYSLFELICEKLIDMLRVNKNNFSADTLVKLKEKFTVDEILRIKDLLREE